MVIKAQAIGCAMIIILFLAGYIKLLHHSIKKSIDEQDPSYLWGIGLITWLLVGTILMFS